MGHSPLSALIFKAINFQPFSQNHFRKTIVRNHSAQATFKSKSAAKLLLNLTLSKAKEWSYLTFNLDAYIVVILM
jgi:hypothetical protein